MPIGQDGRCWAESWWRSGFLHCAAHDKAVSSFGRNDGCWLRRRKQTRATATATAKATATATATANTGVLRCAQNDKAAGLEMTGLLVGEENRQVNSNSNSNGNGNNGNSKANAAISLL